MENMGCKTTRILHFLKDLEIIFESQREGGDENVKSVNGGDGDAVRWSKETD